MALVLHGLVATDTPPLSALPGQWLLPAGGLCAIVSTHEPAMAEDTSEADIIAAALRHNDILMAYAVDRAVVPMRFGAVFSTQELLRAHITADIAGYRHALARLDGMLEYAVALTPARDTPAGPARPLPDTGRAFLQSRLAARSTREDASRNRRSFAAQLIDMLSPSISATQYASEPRAGRLLDASVLVAIGDRDRFVARAAQSAKAAVPHGLNLTVTGPLPAYSFARIAARQEAAHVV